MTENTEPAFDSGEQMLLVVWSTLIGSALLVLFSIAEGIWRLFEPMSMMLGGPYTPFAMLYITVPMFVGSVALLLHLYHLEPAKLEEQATAEMDRKAKPRAFRSSKED